MKKISSILILMTATLLTPAQNRGASVFGDIAAGISECQHEEWQFSLGIQLPDPHFGIGVLSSQELRYGWERSWCFAPFVRFSANPCATVVFSIDAAASFQRVRDWDSWNGNHPRRGFYFQPSVRWRLSDTVALRFSAGKAGVWGISQTPDIPLHYETRVYWDTVYFGVTFTI